LVAGLRTSGLTAPVVDGALNGDIFRAYVEQIGQSRQAISSLACAKQLRPCGASLVYLPPYDPDLNPIEQAFRQA
jgi:transposase